MKEGYRGARWYTCVEHGEMLFLGRRVAWD